MNWTALLEHYGYFAVMVGAFFEGETVMLLGAYAAHQHYLHLLPLILAGAAGGFAGDQFYYSVGKAAGKMLPEKYPGAVAKINKVSGFIDRYPVFTVLLMRFAWGLRTVLPMTFGMKGYCRKCYVAADLAACLIWSSVIILAGVKISAFIHKIIGKVHARDIVVAVTLLLLLTVVFFVYRRFRQKHSKAGSV